MALSVVHIQGKFHKQMHVHISQVSGSVVLRVCRQGVTNWPGEY